MMGRKRINERSDPQAFRALCQSRKIDTWHRASTQRCKMMLGYMEAVKTCRIEHFTKTQAVFVMLRQRQSIRQIQMIHYAEFHRFHPCCPVPNLAISGRSGRLDQHQVR